MKRAPARHFTTKEERNIVQQYVRGYGTRLLGRMNGVTAWRINLILAKHHVPRRNASDAQVISWTVRRTPSTTLTSQ